MSLGAVVHVTSGDGKIDLVSASGNFQEDSQYYIASINKFFVSALVLKLYRDNRLDLQGKISKYLPEETVGGLHRYKGKDHSCGLTIAHLISHTSGLPCYLVDKQANGKKVMTELVAGIDQSWPIEKVVHAVKGMKAHFPPGENGKAKYVDTNHQILSKIIENIEEKPINDVLNNLFVELEMTKSYVCEDVNDNNYVPIPFKSEIRNIPLFLTSTKNEIISTAKDQMTFLKAFFNGYFFPVERLKELEKWNKIFFPFEYGLGIQKFYMPGILTPFHSVPDMIGHCGSTGSVAFHVPSNDLYITGTTNQAAKPSIAFQIMIKIITKL